MAMLMGLSLLVHGEILHPGWDSPEISPDEEIIAMHLSGELRLRRWKNLHAC